MRFSLASSRALGRLHVATTASDVQLQTLKSVLTGFTHTKVRAFAALIAVKWRWERWTEWLKARFVASELATKPGGPLVYVESDMLFPSNSRALFLAAFSAGRFDVAYTARPYETNWGTINSGVVLYNATPAAVAWADAIAGVNSPNYQKS